VSRYRKQCYSGLDKISKHVQLRHTIMDISPRNMLLPRLMNKATMATLIQGDEDNLLHSRSN
jgi:hypothetical protein